MTKEQKIICKNFLNDADKTHSCNEYKLLMALLEQESNCSEIPTGSTTETLVSLGAYKQVAWERDIAIEQLHELGYEFGQKIEPTKNDLGVDAISRADVLKLMQDNWHTHDGDWAMQESMDDIRALPSVTPQEPQSFKWCTDCKEYDQEKHCCHRWSKVIRDTVAEIKQESRWIPVTEDVPPIGTICLWCNKHGSVFTSAITYRSEFISRVGKHGFFYNGVENYGDIVAWMPLPKAEDVLPLEDTIAIIDSVYKAESENKE